MKVYGPAEHLLCRISGIALRFSRGRGKCCLGFVAFQHNSVRHLRALLGFGSSMKNLPIELSIVDRLEQMFVLDIWRVFQVGDGSGHSQDFIVGSG